MFSGTKGLWAVFADSFSTLMSLLHASFPLPLPEPEHRNSEGDDREADHGLARRDPERIQDDSGRRDHEQDLRVGIAPGPVGPVQIGTGLPQANQSERRQRVENPGGEYHVCRELAIDREPDEDSRPERLAHERHRGSEEARVDGGELAEEEPVVRHGVEDARSAQDRSVQRAEHREQDGEIDESCAEIAADRRRHVGGDSLRGRLARGREDIEVREVRENVHHHHEADAPEHRARNVSLRVLDLARGEVDVVPSVVGPERIYQSEAEKTDEAELDARREQRRTVRGAPRVRAKGEGDEEEESSDLEEGEEHLNVPAGAHAGDVDPRQKRDCGESRELLSSRSEVEEVTELDRDSGSESGDAPRPRDEELRPSEEEARAAAESLADVDVVSACFRDRGAELGISERSEESEKTRDEPHDEDPARRLDGGGNRSRDDEDSGADHRAGVDRESVGEVEVA